MKTVSFVIEGRATKSGAYTSVMRNTEITVEEFDRSKTGNHWSEKVTAPAGTPFAVVDITNSGKHHCFMAQVADNKDGYAVTRANRDNSDPSCIVCDAA